MNINDTSLNCVLVNTLEHCNNIINKLGILIFITARTEEAIAISIAVVDIGTEEIDLSYSTIDSISRLRLIGAKKLNLDLYQHHSYIN